ncbi:MAG: hopanoid biosynthesis-associated protein HpnK [Desulfuromonadaceae bacterium]|nr:hopanoid biosynthesis-associated protein HpnK [Desulfuromonadaceae bacterium]MDD2855308.1 hopanoid biosynthesis-associated protein HpnK [Desulfuromonadaceae bacterium]
MKQLIVTSDDFGLSTGVNSAVEQAWQSGILTVASLIPAGNAFDGAVAIALKHPALQIGLHLTLVQGRSVLTHEEIPGLVDNSCNFSDNPVIAGMRYFFNRNLYSQLRNEIKAQIERILDTGIQLTHIDGHLNIHLHPTVFAILLELMPHYGISTLRLSQERLSCNLRLDKSRIIGKLLEKLIFDILTGSARPRLNHHKIGYAAEVKGVYSSGRMTEDYILKAIDSLMDGVSEFYFHPGILPDKEILQRMPGYLHEKELAAITSSDVIKKINSLRIQLVNYRGELKC